MKYAALVLFFVIIPTETAITAAPEVPLIEEVRQGWRCDADQCCFAGLDYCSPMDKRFDRK